MTRRRDVVAAAVLGATLFLVTAAVPGGAFREPLDTDLFEQYGENVVAGEIPYRDFSLEYPPGALPAVVVPALYGDGYDALFKAFGTLCALGIVVLVAAAGARLGLRRGRLVAAAVAVGLTPLLLGPVTLQRFDLWPALLTVAALAALVFGRSRLGLALLAVAATAKLYPLVLVPLALLYVPRRELRGPLVAFASAIALVLGPFALLGPGGLAHSLSYQVDRPLQIETLGSSVLLVLDRLDAYDASVAFASGSHNVLGDVADAVGLGQALAAAALVVATWLAFARAPRHDRDLVLAAATAVAVVVAFGRVLSPQFLLWLVPLVPLAAGAAGAAAAVALAGALVLTRAWYPGRYEELTELEAVPVWLLAARNAVLVLAASLLLAALLRAARRRGGSTRTPPQPAPARAGRPPSPRAGATTRRTRA